MIGKTLAHYEITDKFGQGGMGSVWLVQDSKLGRQVAIKTLPEEFAKDEERLARDKVGEYHYESWRRLSQP